MAVGGEEGGQCLGLVFAEREIWGGPAVGTASCQAAPHGGRTLEVSSLAEGPVTGRRQGVRFWAADKPGLTLKPLSQVDAPAKTSAARLVQLRRMASDFATHLADTRGNEAGVKRQLRLLTQPVFRYPRSTEKSPYTDGALFAFVEGTDPEVFLLLEATRSDDESLWRFGLARMNRDALRVTYRDETVWHAPYIADVMGRISEPYALFSLAHPLRDVSTQAETPKVEVKP